MKTLGHFLTLAILVAIVGGSLSFLFGGRKTYERRIAEIVATEQSETVCPINPALLDTITTLLLRICGDFGIVGYDAAKRYPESARVFETYGDLPEFREVLDTYGHQIIPVIAYFMDNGSKWFRTQATIGDIWQQLKKGGDVNLTPPPPTPEQYGLMTLLAIKQEGHDFLGQFVFKGGEVSQVQLDRMWSTLKRVLTGGILNLERKARRGDTITFRDGAFAALDVAVIGGATFKVVSALRDIRAVARSAEVVTEAERFALASDSLGKSAQFVAQKTLGVAKVAVPIALIYVGVRHPSSVSAAGAWIAWILNLPEWVGVAGIWLIMGLIVSIILTPIRWLFKLCGLSIKLSRICHRGCVWAAEKTTVTTVHHISRNA